RRLNSATPAGTVCQASIANGRRGEAMQARRWRPLLVLATVGAALALGIGAPADVGSGSGPPTSIGHGGAAASVERIATQAAIDTLTKGGNAIDAAVAAAGVLGVTEPFSWRVGARGVMLIGTAGGAVAVTQGRAHGRER